MSKIRVLVIEDSLTVRRRMVEVLQSDPGLEVVGEGADGAVAIELCLKLRPDVITLDMVLPVISGLAATEYIMAYCPTPILIVSASTQRGEVVRTLDALAAGAVDVLDKARVDEAGDLWASKLIATVKVVSRIKVITHPRARLAAARSPSSPSPSPSPAGAFLLQASSAQPALPPSELRLPSAERPLLEARPVDARLIAVGASTGGPGAVLEILRALPPDYPLPILLVLHLADPFGETFASWLDGLSPIRAAHAVDGEPLPRRGEARVIIAPPNRHLHVHHGRLHLSSGPERNFCRPSVDVLFESLAAELGDRWIGALLTGMGKDGAEGLLAARRAGAVTFAQDEESCVVYGMPHEAVRRNAASHVLPIQHFAPALIALAGGAQQERYS